MKWIKCLFRKHSTRQAVVIPPERPADWTLTLDDLFAEVKAGKRKSVGSPEVDWAREYELDLLPEGVRFPQKGDLYESKQDQTVAYMTAWAAPVTGGGEALLRKGERIRVHDVPRYEKSLGTYAVAAEYEELEQRMIPREVREDPRYGGFYFYFGTVDLNRDFKLVQTSFHGKEEH